MYPVPTFSVFNNQLALSSEGGLQNLFHDGQTRRSAPTQLQSYVPTSRLRPECAAESRSAEIRRFDFVPVLPDTDFPDASRRCAPAAGDEPDDPSAAWLRRSCCRRPPVLWLCPVRNVRLLCLVRQSRRRRRACSHGNAGEILCGSRRLYR